MNKKTILLASLFTCFGLVSCNQPSTPKPTSLHINGQSICQTNDVVTFTVNVGPSEADKTVSWSVSNDKAIIDSKGVFTAKKPGEVVVSAVSNADSTLKDKMTVYIIEASLDKTTFLNTYDEYYNKLKANKALRVKADHLADDHIYIDGKLYEGEKFTTTYNFEDSDNLSIDSTPVEGGTTSSLTILDKTTLSSVFDFIDGKASEGWFYYLMKDDTTSDLSYLIYTKEGRAYFNIGKDGYINQVMAGTEDTSLYDLSLTEKPETFDKEIMVTPLKNFIAPKDTVQFKAKIAGTSEEYKDVKWSLECDKPAVLNKVTITSDGLLAVGDIDESYAGTIVNVIATPYADKTKKDDNPMILVSQKQDRDAFLVKYEQLYNKLVAGPALVVPTTFDPEDFVYYDSEHPKEKFIEVKYDLRGNSAGIDFAAEHHRGAHHISTKAELEDDFAQVDIIKLMGGEGEAYFYMDNDTGSIYYYMHASLENENMTKYAEIDSNGYYRTYYEIENDIEVISIHMTPKPYVAPSVGDMTVKFSSGKHANEYKVGDKDTLSIELIGSSVGKCDKVFWSTADESIVSIEAENGELTCLKAGKVNIKATSWADRSVVYSFDITVS